MKKIKCATFLITQAGSSPRTLKFVAKRVLVWLLVSSLWSCVHPVPKDLLTLSVESIKDRQLQTRIFNTADEKMLLTASAAVLQDTGYTIEESEVPLGVILASRERDVAERYSKVCSFFMDIPYDERQKVFASLVTKPLIDDRTAVRITFQHMVWDNRGFLKKNEQLNDPIIYQEFFSKLSKSVFLVAHEI